MKIMIGLVISFIVGAGLPVLRHSGSKSTCDSRSAPCSCYDRGVLLNQCRPQAAEQSGHDHPSLWGTYRRFCGVRGGKSSGSQIDIT